MSKYITLSTSLTSNQANATSSPGPFSIALNGNTTMKLNVNTVDHFIMSSVPTTFGDAAATDFDYYTISSGLTEGKNPNTVGSNVLIDGRGFTASAHSDGTTLDHHGCWVMIKNTTASTSKHIIAIGHTSDADIADDSETDAEVVIDLEPIVEGDTNNMADKTERLFSLRAGEVAMFPYDYTGILYAQATGAGQSLEFWRFDRVE